LWWVSRRKPSTPGDVHFGWTAVSGIFGQDSAIGVAAIGIAETAVAAMGIAAMAVAATGQWVWAKGIFFSHRG
jgi:hypothetical protein